MKIMRRPRPEPHIPFISLADIAWQIIIFFLVAASFAMNNSLNLMMPSSTNDPSKRQSKSITVQASAGVIVVNGQMVGLPELKEKIKSMLVNAQNDSDKVIIVTTADDVPFQRASDVLYAVQSAGGVIVISEDTPGENKEKAQ